MPKIDTVKLIKIGGMILSIAGTIAAGYVSTKENEKTIEKMVEDHFKPKE